MALPFKLQLMVVADDEQVSVDDIVVLDKEHECLEHLGLTLAEAKHSCWQSSATCSATRSPRSWTHVFPAR